MPAGLQVLNFYNQDLGGTTAVALTPGTGDSGTFYNIPQGSVAYLAELWAVNSANPCQVYFTASRFHDQVFGIRAAVPSSAAAVTLPINKSFCISPTGVDQPVFPSDVMTVSAIGADNDKVNVTVCIYYADIPGIAARLATYGEVVSRGGNLVGIEASLTPGSGNWGSTVALNSADNRLHANTDYAVLGFTSSIPLSAIGLTGIDTGNLKTGGPVLADGEHDSQLFLNYARAYDAALVPIINSNNAGSTFLQAASVVNTAATVTVMMVELDRTVGT